ncbi:NERD domain-containing protein [Corallincola platygyrae]|uniref:NERD domain-containing protein n=1 Tax=Corallincola platygyrae TaxID=1193278 RepID=A0ABW4XQ96_9GAMM
MPDMTAVVLDAAKTFWWLIPLFLFAAIVKSPWFKGMIGEAIVKLAARLQLPKETYIPIHNVTMPCKASPASTRANGKSSTGGNESDSEEEGTTQIDHIFVSRFGIFVVETKNMRGWIFGSEKQATWTQKIYRQSFKFQNPLRQNYKHVKTIEAALNIPADTIHSVIAFVGDCTLKTDMPANVTQNAGFIRYIKSFTQTVFTEEEAQRLVAQIQAGRLTPSFKTDRQHVKHLKNRESKKPEKQCPRCGSAMVLRKAKRGANAGNEFWGCSAFPKCRAVENPI